MIPQIKLDGLGGEYLKTKELENRIAEFLGVKHAIMTTSGTTALFLAIKALNPKKVGVPALTMIATANAANLANKRVILADQYVIPDTDCYIHVSLNGRGEGIQDLMKLAKEQGKMIIEDACQSFGSRVGDKYLGTFGDVGCFSFSPHKIISGGQGGCVVTDNDEIANKVRKLKDFGRSSGGGDIHDEMGWNFKYTDIQSEILLKQMDEIEQRIEKKKAIYRKYKEKLGNLMKEHTETPWMVDIYAENRDGLHDFLKEKGIGTRKMYPTLNRQKPYKTKNKFPIFENLSDKGLWLPSSLDITDEEINYVCEQTLAFTSGGWKA